VVLAVLAGLLYNSWPLGFVLDRPALLGSLHDHSRLMRAVISLGVIAGLFLVVSVVAVRWVTRSQTAFVAGCGVSLAAVSLADQGRQRGSGG
jgi:hypothetical protein